MMMKQNGLANPSISNSNQQLLATVMNQSMVEINVKPEPLTPLTPLSAAPSMLEELMDETSPVSGDPFLSASPLSASPRSSISMDESDHLLKD